MDILQKIKQVDFNAYIKTELFLFLFINIIAPFVLSGILITLPYIAIIHEYHPITLNLILFLLISLLILAANVNRVIYAYQYTKSYISIIILNTLSVILAGNIAFVTSLPTIHVTIKGIYEITLGDAYHATPY